VDLPPKFPRKIYADFRTNQAGRAGDEEGFHKKELNAGKLELAVGRWEMGPNF
jgi:hypothetical protein